MVRLRRQLPLRGAPQPEGLAQVGRLDAEVVREPGRDADVLRHQRELETRGEGAGQDLLRDLTLGRAVLAGRGVDRLDHRPGVQTERLRHQQRLEPGERAGRAEIVVQRLDRMAGAERAAMEEVLAHGAEHGLDLLHDSLVAAHHEGERAVARLGDRAGNGRIDHRDLFCRKSNSQRARAGRIRGAHVDDHRAGLERGQGLEHHLAHHRAVRQHGDEHVRAVRRLAHGLAVALAGGVERLHGESGAREVGGHRLAHGAQADEGDGLNFGIPLSRSGRRPRPPARRSRSPSASALP